ncbi:MAG: GTP pyrophosphokinase [Delftia acidovorans]|nr:MAG: GTP pyrophosphokinase [Delftia acidovorans]
MSDIDRAIMMATEAHFGQVDKSGQPYILHPLRVMLAQHDDVSRIVGVLHDVVEDSGAYGHGDILAVFGASIHEAVFAVTRKDGEAYEDFILRARANPIARRVKIADVVNNMRPGAENLLPRYERALSILRAI